MKKPFNLSSSHWACVLSVAALSVVFVGCAGYRLGSPAPKYMDGVERIAVPTFRNSTLLPRVEVLVTNTVIKQLQQDGTYSIGREGDSDVVLEGTIVSVDRDPSRSVADNVRATEEFELTLTIEYVVRSLVSNEELTQGSVSGTTSFFVGNDINQEERIAIPKAAEIAAVRLASEISEGW